MNRERWASSLILGIIFFIFSAPVGIILLAIFSSDPINAFLSTALIFIGPLFGFVMIIVGIIQLIAKKGQK